MRSQVRCLVIPVLAAGLLLACQAEDSSLSEHLARGASALEAGEFDVAIADYRSALELAPESGAAYYGLAKAYFGKSQTREGVEALRAAARFEQVESEPKVQFAQMLLMAGNAEAALVEADAAVALEPDRAATHLIRGQALAALARQEESLGCFVQAVELEPENARAVVSLAVAYQRAGRGEAAEEAFRRVVELEGDYSSVSSLARFLALDPARDEETEATLREAIALAADDAQKVHGYQQLTAFFVQRERFEEGRTLLGEASANVPASSAFGYLLAQLEDSAGNPARAEAALTGIADANPGEARPWLFLSALRGRQGDAEGALAAARRAVEVAPKSYPASLRLAEVLVDQGYRSKTPAKVREGQGIAEAVLGEVAEHPGALMILSKIALAEGKVDDAVASLQSAVISAPRFAQAHHRLGAALVLQGNKQQGRDHLVRSLELDPKDIEARGLLARLQAMLGEHEQAVAHARVVLALQPDWDEVRILAAQNLAILDRGEEAAAILEKVPEDQRHVAILHELGRLALRGGDLEQARAQFTAVLAKNPAHHDTLRDMVPLDIQAGLFDVSVQRIEKAANEHPDDSDLRLLVGVLAVIDGRTEAAERAFKRAVELEPRNTEAYEHLARLYAMRGRLGEAVRNYEVAVAANPDDAHLYHFLGVLHQFAGSLNHAAENYDRAVRLAPDLAEAKNNLAYLLAEAGKDLDRAEQLAREAREQLGGNASVADTLGWVLVKRGETNEAISVLKEAEASAIESTDPGSLGTIRQHLATALVAHGSRDEAGETLKRGLADFNQQVARLQQEGKEPGPEPRWAVAMREMLKQLQTEG